MLKDMMLEKNSVHIEGVVKRGATKNVVRDTIHLLNFCLMVPSDGEDVYVDCFCTTYITDKLGGQVHKGQELAVTGHLTYRTYTDSIGRKKSGVVVYVDDVAECFGDYRIAS